MKARLEFDLDDPDERMKHLQCVSSHKAFHALNEITEMLRRRYKYSEAISDAHYEECDFIETEVHDIINRCQVPDDAYG